LDQRGFLNGTFGKACCGHPSIEVSIDETIVTAIKRQKCGNYPGLVLAISIENNRPVHLAIWRDRLTQRWQRVALRSSRPRSGGNVLIRSISGPDLQQPQSYSAQADGTIASFQSNSSSSHSNPATRSMYTMLLR
jgi:hypothetical protein